MNNIITQTVTHPNSTVEIFIDDESEKNQIGILKVPNALDWLLPEGCFFTFNKKNYVVKSTRAWIKESIYTTFAATAMVSIILKNTNIKLNKKLINKSF